MGKKVFLSCLLLLTLLTLVIYAPLLAAEKLKFGTAVKRFNPFYLPILAAEEKGFWQNNGLEVEWVPFRGSAMMDRAMATKHLNIGAGVTTTFIRTAEKGLPAVMVAEVERYMEFFVWVRADSPIKEVKDLRGAKIGVVSEASVSHDFGKVIMESNHIKGVKFVGTGGLVEGVAALRTGAIDADIVAPFAFVIKLTLAGNLRRLVGTRDYLPKEWIDLPIIARKDFIRNKPATVRRAVRAFLEGAKFSQRNKSWSLDKIKAFEGVSQEVATWLIKYYPLTKDGKIDPKAVENVRNFLVEHGIVSADKTPRVDELYTNEFTG